MRRFAPLGALPGLFALFLAAALIDPTLALATTAVPGFVVEQVFSPATHELPAQIVFLPDGRKFVVEMWGRIRMITPGGTKLPTPFIDIAPKVQCCGGRGLLGVTLDPDFDTNRWVYLSYVVDPDSNEVTEDQSECYLRIERYQASLTDPNVADTTTRQVLLGVDWPNGVPVADIYHTVGALRFAPDGTLLASTGDGAHFDQMDAGGLDPDQFGPGKTDPSADIGSFRSRSLNNLGGKILRLDKETGHGLPSNPYWDGVPTSTRSRIWVYGLRNPFRFAIKPGTGGTDPSLGDPGTLYIGDTGWNTYEEVHLARAGGANFGWPCQEGPLPQPLYQAVTATAAGDTNVLCGAAPNPENPAPDTAPLLWWNHNDGGLSFPPGWVGRAVIGGTFQTGANYPPPYQGSYFAVDFVNNWVRWVTVDSNDQVVDSGDLITALPTGEHIVNLECDPASGDLYYVTQLDGTGDGFTYRVRYLPSAAPRLISFKADSASGTGPRPIPGAAGPWVDLANDYDGALTNFTGDATSGWQGDGTPDSPYRLQFDGVNDRVTVPGQSVAELSAPTAASVALWFKTGTNVTTTQFLYEWVSQYSNPYPGMRIQISAASLQVWLNAWVTAATVEPSTWYHVAVAKDPAGARLYVNGALVHTSSTAALGRQRSAIVLGASTYQGPNKVRDFFGGAIAEASTWNTSLSHLEVLAHYQAGVPLFFSTATKLVELRADSANGTGGYPVPGADSPWWNLVAGSPDATLTDFQGDAASGWRGDGSAASPYRLQFDGVDDRVTIPAGTIPGFQNPPAATASIWFRTAADVAAPQTLFQWVAGYSAPYPGMAAAIGGGYLRAWVDAWVDIAPVLPNTWYNVTIVKVPDATRVFLDGLLRHIDPAVDLGGQVSELVLGASTEQGPGAYSNFFRGSLGQVTVWRRGLLNPEVQEHVYEDADVYTPPGLGSRALSVRADSADGASHYSVPGAASPWVDLASSNDGTLANFDGNLISGWLGSGSLYSPYRLAFDGIDDRVTFPAASVPQLQSASAASVAIWFRTGDDTTTYQYLLEWLSQYSAPFPGMTVGIHGGNLNLWLAPWVALSQVAPRRWYHVVVTKADGAVNAYVNGALAHAGADPDLGDQLSEIVLGAATFNGPTGYSDYFSGAIGQMCVWPIALHPSEVLALFEADSALYLGTGTVGVPVPAPTVGMRAWPNPFRTALTIDFGLADAGEVRLEIFGVDGRRVRTLARGVLEAGEQRRVWDGRDDAGNPVRQGLFFGRLVTPRGRDTQRILYVR